MVLSWSCCYDPTVRCPQIECPDILVFGKRVGIELHIARDNMFLEVMPPEGSKIKIQSV